jgi:peptidoglycan/LPS O-acetylase OafA/YrhL
MTHLVLQLNAGPEAAVFSNYGLWLFLAVGAVALFGIFLPLTTWMDHRRKEREAFYRAETFRRISESSGEGAKAAVELLREESRHEQIRKIEGLKIGGIITLGVGIAMVIFMSVLNGREHGAPFLVGLVPAFVGAAMLIYVYFLASPIQ